MTNPQLLITLILVQVGLLGLLWLGAAGLGLARQPALHWGAMNLMGAAALILVALRGQSVSPWLSVLFANLLGLAAFTVNQRGVQRFCGRPPRWREPLLLLSVFGALLAWAVATDAPQSVRVTITSLGLAYCLVRSGQEALVGLHREFGRAAALGCAAPMLVLGLLFGARGLLSLVMPNQVARPLAEGGSFNLGMGLVVLVSVLLLNLGHGAMVVIRTVAQLRRLSDHDPLTGLLNRRGLATLHERERSRMRRGGRGYAIALIDLDNFKQVNDRHGHDTGDAVLVAVAEALQRAVRPVDGVARTGGEEFCVLLADTTPAAAAMAAERLHQAVRQMAVAVAPGVSVQVTCSIGLSWTGDPEVTMPTITRGADRAMYRAKAEGRDRAVIGDSVMASDA